MSAKIACPYCSGEMSLKSPRAGRFKLTCAGCQKQFALVVDESTPSKLAVRKLADQASAPQSPQVSPAAGKSVEQPSRPTLSQRTTSTSQTDPMSLPDGRAQKSAALEQTIVGEAVSTPGIEATCIGENGTDGAAPAEFSVDFSASRSKARPRGKSDVNAMTRLNAQTATGEIRDNERDHPSSAVPERLGGYRILSELGRGGMGSVYLARQLTLNRKVALKTIQAAWAADPRAIARFVREAYAAAQLTHHNMVQIYDLGEEKGVNFFSMELVGGGSLDELLRKHGKVDPRTAASYILQAARGLKFAHDHGMVHRDVKPANLMLTTDSLVKVADLGLVKTPGLREEEFSAEEDSKMLLQSARTQVTGAGTTLGTPAYMSPEQADDATTVDHRADIYSLGCTFYALLVGRSPFSTSKNALEVISKHKSEKIERPDKVIKDVPVELGRIVERMTERKREDRYQDLSETIADISNFLAESSAAAKVPNKDHASQIEAAAGTFHRVPAAKLRTILPPVFFAVMALAFLLFLALSLRAAITTVFVAGLTTVLVGAVSAVREGSSPIGWVRSIQSGDLCGVLVETIMNKSGS